MGFERSEKKAPVERFLNGDRRILQSITKRKPRCFAKFKSESLCLFINI